MPLKAAPPLLEYYAYDWRQVPAMLLADCGGPRDLTPEHTISSYEGQPTSEAELAIVIFLKSEPWRYAGKRLLHVGVRQLLPSD